VGSIPPAGTSFSLLQTFPPKSRAAKITLIDTAPGLRQHSGLVDASTHPGPPQTDILLVNPAAGGGRAAEVLPSLHKFAQEKKWAVEICLTSSAADLAAKARSAACNGHPRILVLGGDGTFQVLLNAVQDDSKVILGIIPAGGGNDVATALGLPHDPLRAAALLLRSRQAASMDAVRVRTCDGNERLYVGGGGVGIDAEASGYASGAYHNVGGRFRYLLSALRALHGFQPPQAVVSLKPQTGEWQTLKATTLVVAVLNTTSYGAGIHLAPGARSDDGLLDLVILEDRSLFETLALLPSLALRGQLKTQRVLRFRVTCVRIETETPCRFHGDGELLGMTPVELSVVPQAFRILRPARDERRMLKP
jgi:diacylglycerol kinase (ATP)